VNRAMYVALVISVLAWGWLLSHRDFTMWLGAHTLNAILAVVA
jgi:hypothetical protein